MARVQAVDLVVVGPEALSLPASWMRCPPSASPSSAYPSRGAAGIVEEIRQRGRDPGRGGNSSIGIVHRGRPGPGDLARRDGPFVVKADGLAAGKGVLVTDSREEAVGWADQWLGVGPVVIEDFLDGPEVSVFAVCTDNGPMPLEPARDYKRLLDGDQGPNTGGMGSYSPVSSLPVGLADDIMRRRRPTIRQMEEEGSRFRGFLCGPGPHRRGPESARVQCSIGRPRDSGHLPRMTSDLVDVMEGAAPEWTRDAAVNVVLAAEGYPESPIKGASIGGIDAVPDDVLVFHAGTRMEEGGCSWMGAACSTWSESAPR